MANPSSTKVATLGSISKVFRSTTSSLRVFANVEATSFSEAKPSSSRTLRRLFPFSAALASFSWSRVTSFVSNIIFSNRLLASGTFLLIFASP